MLTGDLSYDYLHSLDKVFKYSTEAVEKPEIYLEAPKRKINDLKKATKRVYDVAFKRIIFNKPNNHVLSGLIVNDFDNEQIWQQLEAANNELFGLQNMERISKIIQQYKNFSQLSLNKNLSDCNELNNEYGDDSEKDDNDIDDMISEGSIQENSDDNFEENDNLKLSNHQNRKKKLSEPCRKRRKTEVDDQFFKLDELDEYLTKEDRREINPNKKEDSSDEESIDMFRDFSDPEDDENYEDDEDVEYHNQKHLKYADFFDAPEDNEKMIIENIEQDIDSYNEADEEDDQRSEIISPQESEKNKNQLQFNPLNDFVESDDSGMETKNNDQIKSSLEMREDRLKKKIKEFEEKAISEKPWFQKGEVDAFSRPQNSAIEEILDFAPATRPAPVMTEKTSMKLEDIIIRRIKDKAWDDVEKKFKPVETPLEFKKKLIMNQEKSKESLAQIYENEYLKQKEALNEKEDEPTEEPVLHSEIKEKIYYLFKKLDALSNYHYTPKPAKPELKIISNLPAVNMEEVAPVGTSDATLLAPEEIKNKPKGEFIGKSERTKTDMKRERRKKKLKQRIRALNDEKKTLNNNVSKKLLKNQKEQKKITGRNIIITDESNNKDGKSLKSSSAFFAQLQDQVDQGVNKKTKTTMNSRIKKNLLSAVKLKL